MQEELSKRIRRRWQALKSERSSWDEHWREISQSLLPRNGRFLVEDRNKGDKRFNKILDSTGTRALRILEAGMMSGMTSPARPWFKLTLADNDQANTQAVKVWLNAVTQMMHQVFSRSNAYQALQNCYEELAAFGTSATVIQFDYYSVIHCYPLTVGEYCIATNHKGQVDTLYREFQKTVGQVVDEFGIDNVSDGVRRQYEENQLDNWVTILHAIEPRRNRNADKTGAKNMAFRSVYIESNANDHKVLRESGYKRFPALCPRWNVTGGDIYGSSPGMESLGDIKQLQHEQRRKAQAIDYKTNPPLQMPAEMAGREHDLMPGGVVFTTTAGQTAGIRPLYEVNLDLNHLLNDIAEVKQRINSSFFSDLFLMISNQTDSRMTATEVAERHEEKMLMLGPVLERLQNELLEPLINITFDHMLEAGILPPPPEELHGVDIDVRLVSILAQAQVSIGMNSIDRFMGNVGQIAAIRQDVLDKIDFDQYVDISAESLGVDPRMLLGADAVQAIREQRSQQQQAQLQQEQANQAADTLQKLGAAAGQQGVLDNLTGYT